MEKKYDIVIFGATGFTGQFVVEEVARTCEEENGISWAIAGRSMAKLQNTLHDASKVTGKIPFYRPQVQQALGRRGPQLQGEGRSTRNYRFNI